jgi:transcriptional regulator with XRE-family HTH domain
MKDLLKLGNELTNEIPALQQFNEISSVMGELTFAARMKHGLTQAKLADLAKVSPKTVHRVEGGSGGITDKTYSSIFNVLGISNDDIGDAFKKKSTNRDLRDLVEV